MTKDKYFLSLILIIFLSIVFKLSFIDKFYFENDDLISVEQHLKYKDQTIYTIVNDKKSPSYDNKIKVKIRSIQEKKNKFFDFIEKVSSAFLMRASPSKHSTYAPLQYLIFADLIDKDQNYNELKFNSRIPSVFFCVLYILLAYFFCTKIFVNEKKFSFIASLILILSMPLIYISLRSHNYAAGTLTTTLIFLITYLEMIEKNFSKIKLSNKKINIKKSLLLSVIFSILAYLNYSVFFILPIFFIICFFKHFKFKLKNLITNINFNLFLIGIFFVIFSSPLIFHIFNLNLNEYGISHASGTEYHLSKNEKTDILYVLLFFIKNYYLTISKNISFFTDSLPFSNLLQFILFTFVFVGIFISRNENKEFQNFSNLVIFFFFYLTILVYFEVLTLGPTRHTNFYTPLFAILFATSARYILKYFKKKSANLIYNLILIIIFSFFTFSIKDFYSNYKDPFNENDFKQIIKKYDVAYISTNDSYSANICIMKNINAIVRSCPIKYDKYLKIINLDQIDLKKLKEKKKSIMFVNDEENLSKYNHLLKNENFKLVKKIDKTKFSFGHGPLFLSKYNPNYFKIHIFK